MPLRNLTETVGTIGYDDVELGLVANHLDVELAAKSKTYCDEVRGILSEQGLDCWVLAAHLQRPLVCDVYDARHAAFASKVLRKDTKAMRAWTAKMMKLSARTVRNLGATVVNGFTGSPIWSYLYSFPSVTEEVNGDGYRTFAKAWRPILDVFSDEGVRFALVSILRKPRSTLPPHSAPWRRSADILRSVSTTIPCISATRESIT